MNQPSSTEDNWKAELHLGFTRRNALTVLSHRRHHGPLMVQRPFYPEGGLCHVYLLHPPGGVVAGDHLLIRIQTNEGAEALVTTPAAGKFYRSADQKRACQQFKLKIDADSVLEWLPQETIVYEGARFSSEIRVDLEKDARFIGWEITALGRPAANEGFLQGSAQLSWRIFREDCPCYQEKMHLDAKAFSARWGLNGHSVCATMIACCASDKHLEAVRNLIGEQPGRGVTLIEDMLICRASDNKTEPVRRFFEAVRAAIRNDIVGRKPYAPRIWAT